ncbi:MAG: ATP phosphoribosyltransferase [Fimbriimonadia bacterium]|jgi:ATP phosphoribosyltransferase
MPDPIIRIALPKGRMEAGVLALLQDAGMPVRSGAREYRPSIGMPGFEAKILKPQNIIEMVHLGSRDIGFAGADWVAEMNADVVEILDTGLDPVRLVAAAPEDVLENGKLPARPLVVASEYEKLATDWILREGLDAKVVRSYGATEVFPPEDADCIVDNTASGATLEANNLRVVSEIMHSSTRLYGNPAAMREPTKRAAVDRFVLLLRSVLDARRRVMLEVNVPADKLERVIEVLPCMREPTIAQLHGEAGYAVKAAVPREDLSRVILDVKARGGTDVVVTQIAQIVP